MLIMDVRRLVIRETVVVSIASIIMTTLGNQEECLSEAFLTTQQFLLGDDISSVEPDTSRGVGYLVIVPEMRFNCHRYIRYWSALTQLNSSETYLNHDITFQLWRPSARGSETYDFAGSHTLNFEAGSLRNGLENVDGEHFFTFISVQQNKQRLYFQPGDIIGWYIHTRVQSTEIPLSVVYRQITSNTSGDSRLRPVDMLYGVLTDTHRGHTQPPCELSLENRQLNMIPFVIPYVTVLVNTILPDQPQPESIDTMCDDNASLVPNVITTTAITETTAAAASTVNVSTSSETTVPLTRISTDYDDPITDPVISTAGIVASLVLVAIIFNTMIVILTIYIKRRARLLNANDNFIEASNGIQAQYMENEPRYVESPH